MTIRAGTEERREARGAVAVGVLCHLPLQLHLGQRGRDGEGFL